MAPFEIKSILILYVFSWGAVKGRVESCSNENTWHTQIGAMSPPLLLKCYVLQQCDMPYIFVLISFC